MKTARRRTRRRKIVARRKGAIVVLAAFFLVVMMAMLALSLDVGYMSINRAEVQRSVDAGALAGVDAMTIDQSDAEPIARNYVQRNFVGSDRVPDENIEVELGNWDAVTGSFVAGDESPSAIRVWAQQLNRPLFFGRIFGHDEFSVQAEAVARFQPRDIVLVLDYSASMNDDSELKHIQKMGRNSVEANLRKIYTELGSPTFGRMQWQPAYVNSSNNRTIKRVLGLERVRYPFPGGNWDDYINYVKSNGNVRNAGYRRRYGYLTLVNYWLEQRPGYDETPVLWRTSEQPITAVKDAVTVFFAYLQEADTDDRVGLAVYTSDDGTGKLESGLTDDFQHVEDISRQRQAGHYDHFTNIGAGMEKAREELERHGRDGAHRMIVLMTDGIANRPNGPTDAKRYVRDEAERAAAAGFPVVTISLGSGADTDLMQEVADITQGVHFNVPGGSNVEQYEEDLKDVFRQIAGARPAILAK